MSNRSSIAAIWSGVASPAAHVGDGDPAGQRKTDTSTLSYQSSLSLPICAWSSSDDPTNVSETKVTSTTETAMDTLRRRPWPSSAR